MEVRCCVYQHVQLVDFISPREIRFFCSLRHPSHLPHQPQSHPPPRYSNHIAQIYIPDEGVQWKKVRYDMQPFHLQFFGYFTHLHFACQTRQQNYTQQPNPTQQSIFRSVTKGSAKKKGKQWTAENLSAALYICSLTFIMLLLKSIIPKQPNPNPTQQSATSQIESCQMGWIRSVLC